MAKCSFSIEFSSDPESLVQQANTGITNANGKFSGDVNSGSFNISTPLGNIEGSYVINNFVITVSVNDKPMLLSCKRIETELRKFMG